MKLKMLFVLGMVSFAGCGGDSTPPTNNVLNPPTDVKAKIEEILKQYGITKPVAVVRDNGDYWHVAMGEAPVEGPATGTPKTMTSTGPPDEYKVYKDGRVLKAFDDKPLTKK